MRFLGSYGSSRERRHDAWHRRHGHGSVPRCRRSNAVLADIIICQTRARTGERHNGICRRRIPRHRHEPVSLHSRAVHNIARQREHRDDINAYLRDDTVGADTQGAYHGEEGVRCPHGMLRGSYPHPDKRGGRQRQGRRHTRRPAVSWGTILFRPVPVAVQPSDKALHSLHHKQVDVPVGICIHNTPLHGTYNGD